MARVLNRAPDWMPERCHFAVPWHGCTNLDRRGIEEAHGVDLAFSRLDLDFGRGFYMTTLRRQAEHWAVRRFDSRNVEKMNNQPVVLRFRLSRFELAQLRSLHFVLAGYDDEDYWSLVQHCRTSKAARGAAPAVINDHGGPIHEIGHWWFDMVSGPVVADWKQRAVLQGMDQFSFHTNAGVALLNDAVLSGDPERYSCLPIHD
jgi:hypothetical protein